MRTLVPSAAAVALNSGAGALAAAVICCCAAASTCPPSSAAKAEGFATPSAVKTSLYFVFNLLLKFTSSALSSSTSLYAFTSVPACSPVIVIVPFAGGFTTGVRSGSSAVGISRAAAFSLAMNGFSLSSSLFGTFLSFASSSISAKADVSSIKYRSPSIGSSGTVPVAAAVCIVPISSIIITNTDKIFFISTSLL